MRGMDGVGGSELGLMGRVEVDSWAELWAESWVEAWVQ